MKQIKLFFFLLSLTFCALSAKDDFTIESQPRAMEAMTCLSWEGELKQKSNGFVYLDVSNEFIDKIVPLLDLPGVLSPLPTSSRSMGAHISIFDESEGIAPFEIGQNFSFEVTDIRSFTVHGRDGDKRDWVIGVHAPQLEHLRIEYGLKPKLKGHEFHITLGKQKPIAAENCYESCEITSLSEENAPTEGLYTSGNFTVVDAPKLLKTAQKISALAQLHLKSNGFVYLDVDDAYITDIVGDIPVNSTFLPLSTGSKKMGAHISVIHENETISNAIWFYEEVGQWFPFEVKELRYFEAQGKRTWLLAVEAPALERLRQKYGLGNKLQNHDFHITLGSENIKEDAEHLLDPAA